MLGAKLMTPSPGVRNRGRQSTIYRLIFEPMEVGRLLIGLMLAVFSYLNPTVEEYVFSNDTAERPKLSRTSFSGNQTNLQYLVAADLWSHPTRLLKAVQ